MVNIHMINDAIEIVKHGLVGKIELDDAVVFKSDGIVKVYIPLNDTDKKYTFMVGNRGYGKTYFMNRLKQNIWMPCNEHQPTENGTYLVSGYWLKSKRKVVDTCEYIDEWKCVNNFIIEAWRYLPEAYTKE